MVKVDESLFEEIEDLDIGDAESSDESWINKMFVFVLNIIMWKTEFVNTKKSFTIYFKYFILCNYLNQICLIL